MIMVHMPVAIRTSRERSFLSETIIHKIQERDPTGPLFLIFVPAAEVTENVQGPRCMRKRVGEFRKLRAQGRIVLTI